MPTPHTSQSEQPHPDFLKPNGAPPPETGLNAANPDAETKAGTKAPVEAGFPKPNGAPPPATGPDAAIPPAEAKATTEAQVEAAAPDPFDPAGLRISNTTDASITVERPITVVRVRKPHKQDYFWVHPDPTMRENLFVIEMANTGEYYLVTPAIAALLPREVAPVSMLVYMPRGGSPCLWPLKLLTDDQRTTGDWLRSAHIAAEQATGAWVRMESDRAIQGYRVTISHDISPPVFPNIPFRELLRIGFSGGRLIQSMDHVIVQQLLGKA